MPRDRGLFTVGYRLKRTAKPPKDSAFAGVEEICSLSGCMSTNLGAEDDAAARNALWLFDTVTAAVAAHGSSTGNCDLYAYELAPFIFTPDGERTLSIDDVPTIAGPRPQGGPIGDGFEPLGFDCPQTLWHQGVAGFGCSPLSCNAMAAEFPVNRHCRLADCEAACDAARRFAREQPEPGFYVVVAVWRRRRDSVDT